MAILTFKVKDLLALAQHSAESTEFSPTFGQTFNRDYWKDSEAALTDDEIMMSSGQHIDPRRVPAGFFLVKDHGVYLMSNASPGLKNKEGDGFQICYANGYCPEVDEGWYDKSVKAVGGDDFSEFIPLEWVQKAIAAGKDVFKIRITSKTLSSIS